MKIQHLLQREPFGEIIEKTLSRFLSLRFGQKYQVRWRRLRTFDPLRNPFCATSETWYCNSFLNAIFSAKAELLPFNLIRENYIYTPFRSRRYAQKLYVTLATLQATAPYLATYVLDISPRLPGQGSMLILGGNNRIRLIDLKKKRTWDILKHGFDPVYMVSELTVRQRPGAWPFPTLRERAEDGTWYESDYIAAISLNRLNPKQNSRRLITSAFKTLGRWLDQSRTTSASQMYVVRLAEEIGHLSRKGVLFSIDDQLMIRRWLAAAVEIMSVAGYKELPVELAWGHGDFQNGNILVGSDDRVWIVDWEHSRQRQFAYDYLVFALQSRFPSGLAARVEAAVQSSEYIMKSLPILHPSLRIILKDARQRVSMLLMFLLEDLLWHVRENVNPLFFSKSGTWLLLRKEMGPALQALAIA